MSKSTPSTTEVTPTDSTPGYPDLSQPLPTVLPTRPYLWALRQAFLREGMQAAATVIHALDSCLSNPPYKENLPELVLAAEKVFSDPKGLRHLPKAKAWRNRRPQKPVNQTYSCFVSFYQRADGFEEKLLGPSRYQAHLVDVALSCIRTDLDCQRDGVEWRGITSADVLAKCGESREPRKIMRAALAACGVPETDLRNLETAKYVRRSRATKKRQTLARGPDT